MTALTVGGAATFTTLTEDLIGKYTLVAVDGAVISPKSSSFTVTAGAVSNIIFTSTVNSSTLVGSAIAPKLIVEAVDQFGNIVTTDHSKIILTASNPTQAGMTGTTTVALSNGQATFSNIALANVGTYTLTATPATNSTLHTLNIAATTHDQTITQATTNPIKAPSTKPVVFGTAFTISATLTSNAAKTIPFNGTATLIYNENDTSGHLTGQIAGVVTTAGAIKFSFNPTTLTPGTYDFSIVYANDNNHSSPATVNHFTQVIKAASTKTTLTIVPSSLVFGQSLVLTAAISATPGINSQGHIQFTDNGQVIPNSTQAVNGSTASFTILNPATGKHSYKAIYIDDSDVDFATSTSAAVSRTVAKDKTTLTLTPSTLSPIHNQTFNLNVHLSAIAPGAVTLTGEQVILKDNGKAIGTLTLDSNGDALLNRGLHHLRQPQPLGHLRRRPQYPGLHHPYT